VLFGNRYIDNRDFLFVVVVLFGSRYIDDRDFLFVVSLNLK